MAFEIAVEPERRLGVARLSGTVTGDVIIQAIRALCTSKKWTPGYDTLWDFREMRGLSVSPIEAANVLDLVRHFEDRIGSGRTAIVVREAMDLALFNMLILRVDTSLRERKVFYSLDEALGWIHAASECSEEPLYQKAGELIPGFVGA